MLRSLRLVATNQVSFIRRFERGVGRLTKMAEVKTTQEKTENKRENVPRNKQTCNNPTFNTFDIFCVLFSLGTFVADLSTDIILIVEYSRCGHTAWAVSTLLLMLLPASVIQLFSLRWHKLDEQISTLHYIFHAFLLGIAQRYYLVLRTGLDARASGDITDFQRLYQQQSDLCMLHLFDSFMESAPQLILQLYVMITMGDWHSWTGLSASASLCSLAWAVAAYTRAMRRVRSDKNRVRWPGLVLQATWRGGMLAARISAMVLFALAFNYWLLAVMGIHWIAMTTWVVLQDTDFCPTVWEERIYNGIVGVIYCFSFFNICEGRSRRRVFAFYLVVVTQNVTCLILVISLNLIASIEIIIISTVLILGGTVVGLCSMTLYYTKFHPAGPIPCCPLFGDIETSSPPSSKEASESGSKVNTLRSLKHIWTQDRACPLGQTEGVSLKSSPRSDDGCTDKKLLLENWIARSGSPMFASAPISQDPDNSLDDIEFHTVVNSADTSYDKGVVNEGYKCSETFFSETEKTNSERHKRRGICSPTELGLKLAQLSEQCTNLTPENSTLTSQKRRGICSSDQLVLDLSDLNNIDTLTNPDVDVNVNDDVKLKRRPIYSVGSTLNSFNVDLNLKNMYSVRLMKMCSDDKSVCSSGTLKPEEYMEMSSEVLSAHDYENICAVNIARERWGLRSWEGYTDIETFLHDDSTVRDRRRDTLTSTVTGTSASSEISSSDTASSPPLIPNRRPRPLRSRQDDYLDTLIYDLVDCDKRRVHILDGSDEHEVESNVFIAKPYVVDQHGMFFPLGSTLEPIEELEEPILTPDKVDHIMRKPRSSLVATIDEIRRGTDTDSPRNVYHRTEHVWDDDVQQTVTNIPDVKRVSPVSKNVVKSLWNDNSNSLTIDIKIVEKINSPPILPAKVNNKLTNDASNQETIEKLNIDIFKTSPLNAQKQKAERTSNTLLQGNGNADENRKTSKIGNKPRRKFSLLREKFEPKCKENEEILTSSSMEMGSTVNLIDDLKSAKFTTPVITKVVQWNNVIRSQDKNTVALCEGQLSISDQESSVTSIPDRSPLSSLQDKRNVFLKQVLSPPKFNNRSKRQSLTSKDFNSK